MSFLDSLIKDPEYQSHDPRKPEEIAEPDVIISPDTRRENRIPPGQSRTKKWPVLDAHGAPPIDLATWKFEVDGLVDKPLHFSLDEFMQLLAAPEVVDGGRALVGGHGEGLAVRGDVEVVQRRAEAAHHPARPPDPTQRRETDQT